MIASGPEGRRAFLFYTTLLISGSDVFYESYVSEGDGKSFGVPKVLPFRDSFDGGVRTHLSVIAAFFHRKTGRWILFCLYQHYSDEKTPILRGGIALSEPVWMEFDPDYCKEGYVNGADARFFKPRPLPFPFKALCAVPHGQIIEEDDGSLLCTFYFTTEEHIKPGVLTVKYGMTDRGPEIERSGEPLFADEHARGLTEPSLARLNGRYYLTLRSDEIGLLSESADGFAFSEPQPWRWDDGEILKNYNTMQRWIRFPDALYLAYTRAGAHNDHVFRHRAPLFMTRFDEEARRLVREDEMILVPELGARLGNFSVVEKSTGESWLTTAEWMQPAGCEKYGSDNSVWLVKIKRG